MRHHDVQDELQEGFEVAPTPPIGADGSPMLTPIRSEPPPRPRLCEAGPCVNYHRFEIQTESEDPRPVKVPIVLPEGTRGAQSVPGGTVYHAPRPFHVETHHYCYPTVGIEMRLGALPVVTCNRWSPKVEHWSGHDLLQMSRDEFLASPAGVKYAQDVADWEREREQEQQADSEVERLIEQSMAMTQEQEQVP